MSDDLREFLSGFHSFALTAWIQIAEATGQWPPDSDLTKQRANALYEADRRQRK